MYHVCLIALDFPKLIDLSIYTLRIIEFIGSVITVHDISGFSRERVLAHKLKTASVMEPASIKFEPLRLVAVPISALQATRVELSLF